VLDRVLKYLGIAWSVVALVAAAAFFFGGQWSDWQDIRKMHADGAHLEIHPELAWIEEGGYGLLAYGDCPAGFATTKATVVRMDGIKLLTDDPKFFQAGDFGDSGLQVIDDRKGNGPLGYFTLKTCFKRLKE